MNTPNPIPSSLTPSGSTYGSLVGGALTIVVIAVLEAVHFKVNGSLASAITTLCAVLAGYLPASGRK